MSKISNTLILEKAAEIFAHGGLGEFRIRLLADKLGVVPSVIYHYFGTEEILLRAMFDYLNHELGRRRATLPKSKTAQAMLKQRIAFQIDNKEAIVAVLKYYLAFRHTFPKFRNGFVPDKSALHIEEVLRFGIDSGEFRVSDLENDAKVITHAINGFLLEYFPYTPEGKEKTALIARIHSFLMRALSKGGE